MSATADGRHPRPRARGRAPGCPIDSPMYVHNLSAVGEQYLDFEPPDDDGPVRRGRAHLRGRRRGAAGRRGRPARRARRVRRLGRQGEPHDRRARARHHVRRHRPPAPARCSTTAARSCARRPRTPRRRSGCSTRASGCWPPSRASGENITSLADDLSSITEALADSDDDLEQVLDGTPGRRARGRRAAARPRADAAGAARQRGQRQPGRGLAPRRARAAARDLPAGDRVGVLRHPRRRLRPRQPAARLPPAAVHRGLQAAAASGGRPRTSPTRRSTRPGAPAGRRS